MTEKKWPRIRRIKPLCVADPRKSVKSVAVVLCQDAEHAGFNAAM
jgi:hypothetical protein